MIEGFWGYALTFVSIIIGAIFVVIKKEDRARKLAAIVAIAFAIGLILLIVFQFSKSDDTGGPPGSMPISSPSANVDDTPTPRASAPVAGKIIEFGQLNGSKLEWRVLEVSGNRALLLSEQVLERKALNDTNATWDGSSLRQYLAADFFFKSFTSDERTKIQTINIYTGQNPWYKVPYGVSANETIFLLDIEQVLKYFGGSEALNNREGNSRLIDDSNNSKRQAVDLGNSSSDWCLRTPDSENLSATYVQSDGAINVSGYGGASDIRGVRPALWLKLD